MTGRQAVQRRVGGWALFADARPIRLYIYIHMYYRYMRLSHLFFFKGCLKGEPWALEREAIGYSFFGAHVFGNNNK